MRFSHAPGFLLLCCGLVLSAPAIPPQSERFLDFHSDITLQDDSSLLVTETITLICAGNQIRHGIYRDFPTAYSDPYNTHYRVGFEMVSATRDSAPETFRVEDRSNGKRVYLGDPNTMLSLGQHVYTLTYRTNRQLGFYKDRDELFWNVTGNGWEFPIDHASATVFLPAIISPDQVKLSGFTGPQGSREAQLATATEAAAFQFRTTHPLEPPPFPKWSVSARLYS